MLHLECLHEGIDLAKAQVALGDLEDELSAIVVFHDRGHALGFDLIHDARHCVLH